MKNNKTPRIAIGVILVAIVISAFSIIMFCSKKDGQEDKQNLAMNEETEENKDTKQQESYTAWTTDRINMRKQPTTDSDVVKVLDRYAEIKVVEQKGDWLRVTHDSKEGYVKAEFVVKEDPLEELRKNANFDPNNISRIICIDPGHQRSGDSTQEPNGPNGGTMKARVTGGTRGTTTGLYEYELNLAVAQQLRDELQRRGYTVYMTRDSHDVNISNKERAEFATSVGATITVRIHANGSENAGVSGALALTPSSSNPYVSHLASASYALSQSVLNGYCAATGLANQGVQANDTMTGINWCTMPVTILEMGYMTNPNDDSNMANPTFQMQMVQGIANGIDRYFL